MRLCRITPASPPCSTQPKTPRVDFSIQGISFADPSEKGFDRRKSWKTRVSSRNSEFRWRLERRLRGFDEESLTIFHRMDRLVVEADMAEAENNHSGLNDLASSSRAYHLAEHLAEFK
jgi:hypothetical protein